MIKKPLILKINNANPEKSLIRKAAKVCKQGKILVFPMETVYGVGGRMGSHPVEKRLREITGRSSSQPFVYLVSDWKMLDALNVKKTPAINFMARHFWPGAVTLIVFTLRGKKVAIRFPRNKIVLKLIEEVGEPLIAAGANRNGTPSPHTAEQALEHLHGEYDCLIDGGKTEFRLNSTIVDLTHPVPVVLRKGAQIAEVEKALQKIQSGQCARKRILVVCTGNACRSPMAEGLLKRQIDEKGLSHEIEVTSCGTHARDGVPCTFNTEVVMKNRGMDLSKFRGRLCRGGDLWCTDLIIAMASRHTREISKILPSATGKTITLEVVDPIGKEMDVYEKTFFDIEAKLNKLKDTIFRLEGH